MVVCWKGLNSGFSEFGTRKAVWNLETGLLIMPGLVAVRFSAPASPEPNVGVFSGIRLAAKAADHAEGHVRQREENH